MRERFLNEARASNLVTHRGVARVHDEGVTEDGSIFLVMDLLEGRTLEEHLQIHGPISAEQALIVAHELLDVLAAAHPVDVLHRDIKPANVYLNWDGRVVLLDFGVARLSDARFHTQTGVPVGTLAYMSPEQARGRWTEVDARSDLWSLGATLFTALTGQTVRATNSLAEELSGAIEGRVRSLGTLRQLPKPVLDLVDCALAANLADRFSSALHMREAVREAMTALGIPLPTASGLLPGTSAGLAPSAPEFPRDDGHSSAIRRKQSPPTLAAPSPSEIGQWATNVRGIASPAKYALAGLLACGVAYLLWRPASATPPLELRSELGAFCRVRAGVVAVVHVDAVDSTIGRVSTALGRLRAAAVGELEVADAPPSPRASRGRARRTAIRGPRALPEPATSEPSPAEPVESEPSPAEPVESEPKQPPPFDPLEDRL
jgi:hypothetical protein